MFNPNGIESYRFLVSHGWVKASKAVYLFTGSMVVKCV